MARNMVTRTIISTEVTALCLNLITAEPFNQVFTLAGTYKNNDKIKKAIEKTFNNDEHILLLSHSAMPKRTAERKLYTSGDLCVLRIEFTF